MGGAVEIGTRSNWKIVGFGDVWSDHDVVSADISAISGVVGSDVFEHALDAGNWDGKADAISIGRGGGIDTDDLTGGINEWAARVASVDGSVGLNEVAESLGRRIVATGSSDGATCARDDTGSDGVLELTQCVTNSDDLLTGVDCFRIAESDGR